MRIFYLEPFLIKAERHFIETSISINSYLSGRPDLQFYLIGNKKADTEVRKLLPNMIPDITQTCFENLDDKGSSFYKDLINLDKKYSFTLKDLIIIPTSYENQILGVAKFITYLKKNIQPKIALQFHQLFPPVSESDDLNKISFRRFWIKRLRNAFEKINLRSISYWTSESDRLNKDFRRISKSHVGILPVPYNRFNPNLGSRSPIKIESKQNELIKLAFLGEGRQEKGLLYFLEAIELINKHKNRFLFIIQNMNPRGYSQNQQKRFDFLLHKVHSYGNVLISEGGIEPLKFHKILSWIDALILPYNPINYHRRLSGLLIQAAIYNKPVITSSETWGAYALSKKWASGITIEYKKNDKKEIVNNLINAINQFVINKNDLTEKARLCSKHFSTYNTAEEYLKRIINFYDKNS